MLELRNEVEQMFSIYENEEKEQTLFEDILEHICIDELPTNYSHNELMYLFMQELVQKGTTDDDIAARFNHIDTALYTFGKCEYTHGNTNPENPEDEKFDPLDKFHVRFDAEEETGYDGDFVGRGRMDSYDTLKYFLDRDSKPFELKKERVGIKKELIKQNKKFSLFTTTGSGAVWIPNEIASDDRWMLDHVDQELSTWDLHNKKINLKMKNPPLIITKQA